MSYPLPFSETYRDCLQELANVAMGAAGESLAAYTSNFVELPIPVIRYLRPNELASAIASLSDVEKVSACVQSFATELGVAYAVVVVSDNGLANLSKIRSLPIENQSQEETLLKSLTAVICETCLASLMEMTEREFSFEPVFVATMHQPIEQFHLDDLAAVDFLTSIEITYQLENSAFNCDLLLLFPETMNQPLLDILDKVLAI